MASVESGPVHLGDEPAERRGLLSGQPADLPAKTGPADRPDLVHRDLGWAAAGKHLEPGTPRGVQSARKRTHRHGFKPLVELVEAHDDNRAGPGHFRSAGRVEVGPTDVVALHRRDLVRRPAWKDAF